MNVKNLLVTVILSLSGQACVTTAKIFPAKTVKIENNTITLEYRTGTEGGDGKAYEEHFNQGATAACKNSRYAILERSHVPSTLACAKGVLNPENFYWVIRCENSSN